MVLEKSQKNRFLGGWEIFVELTVDIRDFPRIVSHHITLSQSTNGAVPENDCRCP